MRKIIVLFLSTFLCINCASGTNPYFKNENVGGVIGAGAGAYGGSVFSRNLKLKGASQIAAIGGLSVLGMLLGSRAGAYFDRKDQDRQVSLINKVLESNPDRVSSSSTWNKTWKNPNTGNVENHTVTTQATPQRTYQQNVFRQNQNAFQNMPPGVTCGTYRSDDVRNDNCRPNFNMNQMFSSNSNSGQYCRDITVDITINGLTAEPQRTQWFKYCRDPQTGWRQVQ